MNEFITKLVNKDNPLDKVFVPESLTITDENENNFHNYINPKNKPCVNSLVVDDLNKLLEAAKKEGYNIVVDSGYRSYEYQEKVWEQCIKDKGLEHTLKYVAKPGFSEHQTGLAIDFGCFRNNKYIDELDENDPEEIWLLNNAYHYGFILRYPLGKENITGYNFEPWHFRYVGPKLSKYLYENNLTLEEFYLLNNKTMLK